LDLARVRIHFPQAAVTGRNHVDVGAEADSRSIVKAPPRHHVGTAGYSFVELDVAAHLPAHLRGKATSFGFVTGWVLRGRLHELLQAVDQALAVKRCREIPSVGGVILRHYWP
jgi:hypothetical protein